MDGWHVYGTEDMLFYSKTPDGTVRISRDGDEHKVIKIENANPERWRESVLVHAHEEVRTDPHILWFFKFMADCLIKCL